MIRARLLIATLWAGSLWTFGYLVAPALFATISDRALAGTIAGTMFRIEAWLSVVCAVLLLGLDRIGGGSKNRRLQWIVLGMLFCTLVGYFGFQPLMAAAKEAAMAGGAAEASMKSRFGMLHGISSTFYLLQSVLGVALVLHLRPR